MFFGSQRGAHSFRRQTTQREIDKRLGRNRPLTDDEIHEAMRPRGRRFWVTGALALVVAGYLFGEPLFGLAALVVFAVGMLPEMWLWIALRGVSLRRIISPSTVSIGESFTISYQLENRKLFPVPWLEIEDEHAETLRFAGLESFTSYKPERRLLIAAFTLWINQRVTRTYKVRADGRGIFLMGPAYIRAGDPFGFIESERRVAPRYGADTITVLPLQVPLEQFGIPSQRPFGDLRASQPTFEDPSLVVGARDFQPQDSLRRVHWKATARIGTLQSKVYPPTMNHTLMLFLDVNTTSNISMGIESALMELGIAGVTSVATWAARQGLAVGICSNGLPGSGGVADAASLEEVVAVMRLAPSAHPDQLARLLRILAQLQPYFGLAMGRVLAREEARLPLGATVIYCTAAAALKPEVVRRLERLRRHGHVVAVLLTGDAPAETGHLLTYRIGNAERWNELATHAARSLGLDADVAAPEHGLHHEREPHQGGDGTEDHGSRDQDQRQPVFALG